MSDFATRLRTTLAQYQITHASIGRAEGLSMQAVSKITRGIAEPKLSTLAAIVRHIPPEVDLRWLICGDNEGGEE